MAFLDPPKETAAAALEALAAHGVAVKVLTGDNELVTAQDLPSRWASSRTACCSARTWSA